MFSFLGVFPCIQKLANQFWISSHVARSLKIYCNVSFFSFFLSTFSFFCFYCFLKMAKGFPFSFFSSQPRLSPPGPVLTSAQPHRTGTHRRLPPFQRGHTLFPLLLSHDERHDDSGAPSQRDAPPTFKHA